MKKLPQPPPRPLQTAIRPSRSGVESRDMSLAEMAKGLVGCGRHKVDSVISPVRESYRVSLTDLSLFAQLGVNEAIPNITENYTLEEIQNEMLAHPLLRESLLDTFWEHSSSYSVGTMNWFFDLFPGLEDEYYESDTQVDSVPPSFSDLESA